MADNVKQSLTHTEFVRLKALGILGLVDSDINPLELNKRYTFVNDINADKMERLEEYNIWYEGDSDKLKNFFSRANAIDYNTDPLYNENKKSYFWSVASTERDIKRTHSGAPRNIVDTFVNIMSIPNITSEKPEVDENLKKILKKNKFFKIVQQQSRPLTLVEGWGAWKINWDKNFSDVPIILYYRANRVDFVYRSNQLVAIIYRDYFTNEKNEKFILYETRRIGPYKDPDQPGSEPVTSLYIEKELFRFTNSEILLPCKLSELPQLKDVQARVVITNFDRFLGYPNIFLSDSSGENYGRSIFTGKCDLFDDLDQCLSQSANAVRRSTIHEYFNNLYLETDEYTGLPMMPNAFDRKYIQFKGMQGSDGASGNNSPVQVVQPAINFEQYNMEAKNIYLQIINGLMSPATIGIDIAKKDNASDTREKEKLTIFTRNNFINEEEDVFDNVLTDALIANEYMHTNKITCKDYDLSVQYAEFANQSLESKLETILTGWQGGILSDDAAIDLLWGDSLSKEKKQQELNFLKQQREAQAQQAMSNMPEAQGAFGELGAENAYNDSREQAAIDDLKQDMGIPDISSEAI